MAFLHSFSGVFLGVLLNASSISPTRCPNGPQWAIKTQVATILWNTGWWFAWDVHCSSSQKENPGKKRWQYNPPTNHDEIWWPLLIAWRIEHLKKKYLGVKVGRSGTWTNLQHWIPVLMGLHLGHVKKCLQSHRDLSASPSWAIWMFPPFWGPKNARKPFQGPTFWGPALNPPLPGLKSGKVAHLQTWKTLKAPYVVKFWIIEPQCWRWKVYKSLKNNHRMVVFLSPESGWALEHFFFFNFRGPGIKKKTKMFELPTTWVLGCNFCIFVAMLLKNFYENPVMPWSKGTQWLRSFFEMGVSQNRGSQKYWVCICKINH